MTKRGRPKSTIQLTTGNDPKLWKYASLAEALQANVDLLAQLILADPCSQNLLDKRQRAKTEVSHDQ